MIDCQRLLHYRIPERRQAYTRRDTIFYALSLGFGERPTDPRHLEFVYEEGLSTLPTMANVLAQPGFWVADPETTIDARRLLHGEQRVRLMRPLPPEATVTGHTKVLEVVDKGSGHDSLVRSRRRLVDDADGETLAEIDQLYICRGQGGGGSAAVPDIAPLPVLPEQAEGSIPAFSREVEISPQCALLYRLNGDMNPLHASPARAAAAGFDRPILHGLASFGLALRALTEAQPDLDVTKIEELSVRFSAPVFPGDRMTTDFWAVPDGYAFVSRVAGRDRPVLTKGRALVRRNE